MRKTFYAGVASLAAALGGVGALAMLGGGGTMPTQIAAHTSGTVPALSAPMANSAKSSAWASRGADIDRSTGRAGNTLAPAASAPSTADAFAKANAQPHLAHAVLTKAVDITGNGPVTLVAPLPAGSVMPRSFGTNVPEDAGFTLTLHNATVTTVNGATQLNLFYVVSDFSASYTGFTVWVY